MTKLISRSLLLIAGVLLSLSTVAVADSSKQFSEPNGEFSLSYPAEWQPAWGVRTMYFSRPAGKEVRISIGGYPLAEEPPTAAAYVESALAAAKLLESRITRHEEITVSGNPATRLEYSTSQVHFDQEGKPAADRISSVVEIVFPVGARYYVLSLTGLGEDVIAITPEFERMVNSFLPGKPSQTLTEWSGIYNGAPAARMLAARNPEELQKMIGLFGEPVRKLIPEGGFDFKNSMLVGISLGQKPTGGYSVRIVGTREEEGVLYIRYREKEPDSGEIVTQALTAPYHLKVLPASNATSVRFEKIALQ